MSSNTCLLVARDTKTNDFEIKKKFKSLKEADLYTTNYHNSKDLAKQTWQSGIVPDQDIDFFIIMPFMYNQQLRMETKEVLFSNSKEIRMINDHEKQLNTLKHFEEKIESSNEFLDEISICLYEDIKNYLSDLDENKTISYQKLREAILSFNENLNSKAERKDLYRLIIERKLLNRFSEDYNEKQLSIGIEEEDSDSNKIVEIISTLENIGQYFLDIKDGKVFITNNICTMDENIELLDSLLDQRLGFILHAYLQIKNEDDKNKKILLENAELKMIEILSNDKKTLNNTYKLIKIINNDENKLVGDTNGYQYKRN